MEKKNKTLKMLILLNIISFGIFFIWNYVPIIKQIANFILNPTIAPLLEWNISLGMTLLVIVLTLFVTILQKYTVDQKYMKELKKERKKIEEEIKRYREDREKMMELQKELFPISFKMMELSLKSSMYSIVFMILLFRWLDEFFVSKGNPLIFNYFNWIVFYILASIFFGSIFRKLLRLE